MTLAEHLNDAKAEAGCEDGALFLTDGRGCDLLQVGPFHLLQTNSGPDLRVDTGGVEALAVTDADRKTHKARYTTEGWKDS